MLTDLPCPKANFSKAELSGAKLCGATLTETSFVEAVVRNADFTKADLSGAVLQGADLTAADLSGADLTGTKFAGALNLRAATFDNLRGAILDGADLTGVDPTGVDFVGGSFLAGSDIRSNSVITSLARLASGCMTISVRFGTGGDDDQYLGVLARNLNGESYSRMREQNAWSVKHLSQPFADGIAVTKAQVAWSLKGQDIKMVVDASAGRVSFHSAASGQTVVMDGLPKGELWLAVGLYQNSATVLAVDVPAAPPAAQ